MSKSIGTALSGVTSLISGPRAIAAGVALGGLIIAGCSGMGNTLPSSQSGASANVIHGAPASLSKIHPNNCGGGSGGGGPHGGGPGGGGPGGGRPTPTPRPTATPTPGSGGSG